MPYTKNLGKALYLPSAFPHSTFTDKMNVSIIKATIKNKKAKPQGSSFFVCINGAPG